MFFRKSFQIALVAAIFCRVSYHADAHCFNHDGSRAHDHHAIGCDPTISPAPTESPAPSPSPSASPTDTQMPSRSPAPSSSPSAAPTTSEPSSKPSASPTESPAPSPSPSGVPSAHPTTSFAPSKSPTDSPSESPTERPSASPTTSEPSESPTGPIALTVLDVETTIQNVTGDRIMNLQDIDYFERETTLYLQNHIEEAPGVLTIEVENVVVTDQNLITFQTNNTSSGAGNETHLRKQRRLEGSQTDLIVTIDVVVSVLLNRSEDLRLNDFFEVFFGMPQHRNELRGILEQEESFARGIFIEELVPSSEVSANSAKKASNSSAKKASNRSAVTGAVLGVIALIVGSGLIWMWVQTRRNSSDSLNIKNIGTISKSFESDDRRLTISNFLPRREIAYADSNEHSDSSVTEYGFRRKSTLTPLGYVPTLNLMPTEDNIEVPDTPVTNFAVNGFATPASAAGFATPVNASGFMTPMSTKSKNSSATFPKLLGETSMEDDDVSSNTPKESKLSKSIKKIPLPPKILSPLKSPFRRPTKSSDEDENRDCDPSSISREGVVAGKNNVPPSSDRKKKKKKMMTEAEMILQDLPLEIGGPSGGPRPTIIPVEEDIVFRPSPGQNSKNYPYSPRSCPPQTIGGPHDTDLKSTKSAKKKDHSVVDIVDEIAWLYSSKEPERYGKKR